MAKPAVRKPKKKVCAFCKDKVKYVDYKDTERPQEVHLRPRQDPRSARDGLLHPPPARRGHRDQECP